MDMRYDSFENFITQDSMSTIDNCYTYSPKLYTISKEVSNVFYYITYFKKCTISDLNYYIMNDLLDYCFLYTEQGEGLVRYKEQDYALSTGSILFINGMHLEQIHAKEMKEWNFYFILLNGKNISSYYDLCAKGGVCLLPFSKYSNIPAILKKLDHYATPTSMKDAAILSKFITDFLTELFIETNLAENTTEAIPNYILKIKELFDTKYAEPHTLDSIDIRL